MDPWQVIESIEGPRLSIPIALVAAFGDLRAAAFLQQAAFLSSRARESDGWFFLAQSGATDSRGATLFAKLGSWQATLGLSPDSQLAIRRKLRGLGLLEEALRGVPARLHYRVHPQKYLDFLGGELPPPVSGEPGNQFPENSESCFGETQNQGSGKARTYKSTERKEERERTGLAAEPVDNSESKGKTQPEGKELDSIRESLDLNKAQLGALLNSCKAAGCSLQDVHASVRTHLDKQALQGAKAFAYLKACISENPGRDWTHKARRDAELEAQAATTRAEDQALASAIQRLANAGSGGVEVTRKNGSSGRLVSAGSGLVQVLDELGRSLGLAPLHRILTDFPHLGEGR